MSTIVFTCLKSTLLESHQEFLMNTAFCVEATIHNFPLFLFVTTKDSVSGGFNYDDETKNKTNKESVKCLPETRAAPLNMKDSSKPIMN